MKRIEKCPIWGKELRFHNTRLFKVPQEICDYCDIKFDYDTKGRVLIEYTKGSNNNDIYWDGKYHPIEFTVKHISNSLDKEKKRNIKHTIQVECPEDLVNSPNNIPLRNISEKKISIYKYPNK